MMTTTPTAPIPTTQQRKTTKTQLLRPGPILGVRGSKNRSKNEAPKFEQIMPLLGRLPTFAFLRVSSKSVTCIESQTPLFDHF